MDPNGVTLILNALLHLGIRIERDINGPSIWKEFDNSNFLLKEEQFELIRWLPSLHPETEYQFAKQCVVYWSHENPQQLFSRAETSDFEVIVLARDPRDGLYSSNRRYRPDLSFKEFLNTLDPKLLVNRIDAWKYFYSSWMILNPSLTLTYEALKESPGDELNKFFNLLGIQFDLREIREALEASTFKKAQKRESDLVDAGLASQNKVNLRGKVNEHLENKENYSEYREIAIKLLELFRLIQGYKRNPIGSINNSTKSSSLITQGVIFLEQEHISNLVSLLSIKKLYSNFLNSRKSQVDHESFFKFILVLDSKITLCMRENTSTKFIVWLLFVHPLLRVCVFAKSIFLFIFSLGLRSKLRSFFS